MSRNRVLAISGSLRGLSFNTALLRAAAAAAPPSMRIELYEGAVQIPVFSEDLEAPDRTGPAPVEELRQLVQGADGLLIATPEYNQSLPGSTKNLIDWLSRGPIDVLEGQPVAITGASNGPWGTRYAQKELRHTLTATGAYTMPAPMLFLARADQAFDDGGLVDPTTIERLGELLVAFDDWIDLVGRGGFGSVHGAA